MKIALAGNPNSGKTTLFNEITGKIEHVGNWAGVTIEKKEGSIKRKYDDSSEGIVAIDLPGAYSMSPYTKEESITKEFILSEKPDVIINIVDATNLSRSLFLTTQLLELGIPLVVALNKSDLAKKKGLEIDIDLLEKKLNCIVLKTISTKNKDNGLRELIKESKAVSGNSQKISFLKRDIDYSKKEVVKENDRQRYEFVKSLIKSIEVRRNKSSKITEQDKIDRFIAHKWLGIPIFAVVMWMVFSISQTYVGTYLADILTGLIDKLYVITSNALSDKVSPLLSSIILDGMIGGFSAVVGFLPLIMILFFLLALLEDVGYMARVAVVLDRFFKKVGLSGKSIIPMIVGTGCAIPGIMATRTIKDERQRRTTAMLTPFMPCGAKLPVIALFAGVFFNGSSIILTAMYFLSIFVIAVSALIVRRITKDDSKESYFIMELPEYRIPSLKRATVSMFSRGRAFIVKAATIILLCNMIVQIMQTFNWRFEVVLDGTKDTSILASIASPFAILLIPLGFGAWQLAAGAIAGFIAKENVIGTLAVVYGISNFIDTEELVLISGATDVAAIMNLTGASALAYLVFNLFSPPCFAAIGAMNAEFDSKKWFFGAIGFQLGMGYTLAFFVYQIGTVIETSKLGDGFLQGLVAIIIMALVIVVLINKRSFNLKNRQVQKA